MSDQNDSTSRATGSVQVVVTEEAPSFLNGGLDLKSLLRSLKAHSKTAVDKLVLLMSNDDPKVALAAAKTLLEMHATVAKDMNTDQLQRLIAQVKLGSGRKELVPVKTDEEEEDDKPVVDFTTIRKIQ